MLARALVIVLYGTVGSVFWLNGAGCWFTSACVLTSGVEGDPLHNAHNS